MGSGYHRGGSGMHVHHMVTKYSNITYTIILLYSRNDKGIGLAHEVTSPKNLSQIFLDDDGTVLVRPKQAFRNASNKSLQNFESYLTELTN